jgi:hypothetical protein
VIYRKFYLKFTEQARNCKNNLKSTEHGRNCKNYLRFTEQARNCKSYLRFTERARNCKNYLKSIEHAKILKASRHLRRMLKTLKATLRFTKHDRNYTTLTVCMKSSRATSRVRISKRYDVSGTDSIPLIGFYLMMGMESVPETSYF